MTLVRDRKPISCFFVLPNFRAGGAERVVLSFLSELDRDRFAPELIVFQDEGVFADLRPADVPMHILGAKRMRSVIWPLVKLIRTRRPDLVFSSHSYVNLALLASRLVLPNTTKIVVREPSTPSKSLPDTNYGWLLNLGYHVFFRRADRVICLNEEAKQDLATRFRVNPSRLVLLPNPVAVSFLRDSVGEPCRDGAGRRLVAAGRLTRAKGFDSLLRALKHTDEDVFLTIYGDGPEEDSLQALCRSLGLQHRVRFAGFEKHLAAALAGADALVAPSRWEGFPNIVLEALACGTVVISSSSAGGVRELARELPENLLTLISSEQELAAAMNLVRETSGLELRPNLVPLRFQDKYVVKQFGNCLEGVV